MIINVKASSSVNAGEYLTDREKEAYTIIEGDSDRFDYICSSTLENNKKKKISHYSYVLSFEEEHLTKDNLINYYMQFKEKMFSNYNIAELEVLAVIHFDDNKPHIHCTVVNSSQIDNDRDLRLYRGYPDFSRIESIQETINYNNDLTSVFDNYNLLSLTAEQKKRDWQVKKRDISYYGVFDDIVHKEIEDILKQDLIIDYDKFINKLELKFGKTEVINFNKSNTKEVDKTTFLKESKLVLKDHVTVDNENYTFPSKLFDRNWFNKNIVELKTNLLKKNLKQIKYQIPKKSLASQNRILKETTSKHENHIYSRKVGNKYLKDHFDFMFENNLNNLESIKKNELNMPILEEKYERLLSDADDKNLKKFIERIDIDKYSVLEDHIEYNKDNFKFRIYNNKLIETYKKKHTTNNSNNKELLEEQLSLHLKTLKSNKSKAKARLALEELFYKNKIKSKEEFEFLLNTFKIKISKAGTDKTKGSYLTLESNRQKFRIYNNIIYNLAFEQDANYKIKRDKEIKNELKDKFLNNYIASVYLELHKNNKYNWTNSVNDYRLKKSNDIIDSYFEISKKDSDLKNHSLFRYKNHKFNDFEQVEYSNIKGSLTVKKSLNKKQSGKNIADLYFAKGTKNIQINKDMDKELLEGFIERVKEKKYDINVLDSNDNFIYINNFEKEKEMSQSEIDYNAKEVFNRLEKDGGVDKILNHINTLDNLDFKTKEDLDTFRKIMKDLNRTNKNSLESILTTVGINVVRVGRDNIKGDYATFEYKDKKIAVYDKNVVSNVRQIDSSEVVLTT